MSKLSRNLLLAGCALGVISPSMVLAQETATEEDSVAVLTTVVVNAQRRDQSILDVPVAVSSLSAELLEAQEINNIFDVMTMNPSVSGVTIANPTTSTDLRIRGIGTTGSNAGFEASVGTYIDDIYYSRPGLALISFYDVGSVEILRGPQGTLFGKNISAGAILQKTQAPILGENSGYLSAEFAEFNSQDYRAAANIALGEKSAFRIAGVIDNTDGYLTNVITNDDAAAFTDVYGVRAQFLTEPTDDLSIRLTADTNQYESGRHYQQNNSISNPDGTPIILPDGSSPSFYEVTTSYPSNAVTEQWGLAAHVEYAINDNMELRSITSYREVDSENFDGDFDFSLAPIAGDLDEEQDHETFSQEFLLTFETDRAFFTTGLHYFSEDIDFFRYNVELNQAAFPSPSFQDVRFAQSEESFGIFAHADVTLTDQFSLIGGLRWTQVEKDINFENVFGTPEEYYDAITSNPFTNLFFFLADGGLATAFPYSDSISFEEPTYDIALQWRPTDRLQTYVKYSRGFKAGGFNITEGGGQGQPSPLVANGGRGVAVVGSDGVTRSFNPLDVDGASFNSEFVDAYEASVRYQLDRGIVSATAFYSEFTDLQVAAFAGLNFTTLNAGTAETQGLELEGQYDLTDELSLNGAVTFLDTSFGSGPSDIGVPRGRDLVQAPDVSLVLGAIYERELTDNIRLNAAANIAYHSEEYSRTNSCFDANGQNEVFDNCERPADLNVRTPNANAFFQNEATTLVNGSIGLTFNDTVGIELFCTNCLDEEYINYSTHTPVSLVRADYPGAPSIAGVRLRVDY